MSTVLGTADVVVVGGGVAGLSTAMQLAGRGARVIVLERAGLGSGSTGRAAGLLGQLRGTAAATGMLMDGVKIVAELEAESGQEIYVQTGSLRIGETPERAQEVVDLVEMGKAIGFDVDLIDRDEVARLVPYMKTDDLLQSCYCPTDGHLQPAELTAAYVQVGRARGVEYRTQSPVEGIVVNGGKVAGVRIAAGEIHAAVVVNAGGPWSYLVAELAETSLPTAALGHYYLTTRPQSEVEVARTSPAVRDRHHRIYTRPEGGGLIVGIYEAEPQIHEMRDLPADFDMAAMKAARDDLRVATLIHAASQRFPWIDERTPMSITRGIMTFTPNGKPFCGRFPDLEGLFHCSGFSGHGIVQSPVIGVIMADLILDGKTAYDITEIEADRYFDMPELRERATVVQRCCDMAGSYYGRIEGSSAES